tara:strand:- start:389 stop:691 length:303 start_codon:yes stop_codon:yes gene_type:complete
MTENNQPQAPRIINFDDKDYEVSSLTPRVADGFNTLVRVQQEINELAYQMKVKQAAQVRLSEDLKVALKEDKVPEAEGTGEPELILPEDEVKTKDKSTVN